MKGSLLWKLMYLFCAMAGILAGYGIFTLTGVRDNYENAKDSTLVREDGDSVLFVEEQKEAHQSGATGVPEPEKVITVIPSRAPTVLPPTVTVAPTVIPTVTLAPATTDESDGSSVSGTLPGEASENPEDKLPSLGMHWATAGEQVPELTVSPVLSETQPPVTTEVITYPAKIFGQVPVINRSDAYVSYFEFCYDLIAMMEPEVAARGLNLNALMTKFALKALLCGVDIEKLDINAPIPRRLAALCLWLAAQVLNESGYDTSSQSAGRYVTDISTCSSSERKAVAYLYKQGVVKGYQVPGQRFYPQEGLKTESGKNWLSNIKQCWK